MYAPLSYHETNKSLLIGVSSELIVQTKYFLTPLGFPLYSISSGAHNSTCSIVALSNTEVSVVFSLS